MKHTKLAGFPSSQAALSYFDVVADGPVSWILNGQIKAQVYDPAFGRDQRLEVM